MRRLIATAAATILLMTAVPALAGGYYGHHYGHRHHGHHGHHGGHGYYVLGALLAGVVIGDLVARASTPPPVRYVQAPPQPQLGRCQRTTGTARVNGRLAQFGGTICYDAAGQAYILNGSRHFIGYLQ